MQSDGVNFFALFFFLVFVRPPPDHPTRMWTGQFDLSDLSANLNRGLGQLGELAAGAVDAAARVKADVEASLDASLRQAAEGAGGVECE